MSILCYGVLKCVDINLRCITTLIIIIIGILYAQVINWGDF